MGIAQPGTSLSSRHPVIGRLLRHVPHWCRAVMNRDIDAFLASLPVDGMAALEISGDAHGRRPWRSHETLAFPAFDICTVEPLDARADVVFCEQVLEHVADPMQAARNLHRLLYPDGHAIVSTPFLVRIHPEPDDYWRFSPAGLELLLTRAGFEVVAVNAWGNEKCVRANLRSWRPYVPFLHTLDNEPALPIVVWAIARRPS